MATFAAKSFNAAGYLSARPIYPKVLYERVFSFHKGGMQHAVDLGAGSGQATQALTERITGTVTATDPSPSMLEQGQAKLGTSAPSGCQIEWKVASAENMPFLPDQSVDLVVSGQAAHWFDHDTVWKELQRVVRPKGTVAYWGYGDMLLPKYATTKSLIANYMYNDHTLLGPHWEPGRSIVSGLYAEVPWPSDESNWNTSTCQRVRWTGESGDEALVLKKEVDWPGLEAYLRTFSAFHNYSQAHPEDASHAEGDLAKRFLKQIQEAVASSSPNGKLPDTFELAWPLALMMIARK